MKNYTNNRHAIETYEPGEKRVLAGYKAFTGKALTVGAAKMYNRACDTAHSFGYDEPSLNSRHIAFCVAAGC